ncbi:hypothetical protein J4471_04995 [Candidatus Woesearchaeota archaeon]|nr:hypothetical protein [Candidatus Woesearchaeota archaeon]
MAKKQEITKKKEYDINKDLITIFYLLVIPTGVGYFLEKMTKLTIELILSISIIIFLLLIIRILYKKLQEKGNS